MSVGRPVDWTPLAASDPIPGDPDRVLQAGRNYELVAQAIAVAAAKLRTIAADVDMQSDAVAGIRTKAHDLAEQIKRAQVRYEGAAVALKTYAPLLDAAQKTSVSALNKAKDAAANQGIAARAVEDAQVTITVARLGADTSADHQVMNQARRSQQLAADALAEAVSMLNGAIADRDTAAEAARRTLDEAKKHDGLKDSTWDNIKSAIVSTLKAMAKIADIIAVGAGILALVTAAIPFVGEFFAAVALYAAVASLALKLTLKAFGEGSWTDIAIAAVGVATFGVGKVAMGGAELSALGTRSAARLAAGRAAAEAPAVRAAPACPPMPIRPGRSR